MASFGIIPPEPPAISALDLCCPRLQRDIPDLLTWMMVRGSPSKVRESIRTNERQVWLHGFGRQYDDDRGIVTNVPTKLDVIPDELAAVAAEFGWHFFGCGVDIVHAELEDQAPESYWEALAEEAERLGLSSGKRWAMHDDPHVQLGKTMRVNPSDNARTLYARGGRQAVWAEVGGL